MTAWHETRVSVTLELLAPQVDQLDRIAAAKGVSREAAVASLVGREFEALRLARPEESPWTITRKAVDDLLEIMRRGRDPESISAATEILRAACVDAYLAEREGRRKPREGAGGTLRYRGPKPRQLTLVVWRGTLIGVSAGGRHDR